VSFDGFLDKSNSKIKEMGINHLSFTTNSGLVRKFIVIWLIRFLSVLNNNKIVKRWISTIETYSALKVAKNICNDEDQSLIFCSDGELAGFLLFCSNTSGKKIILGRMEHGRTLSTNNSGRKVKRYIENWLCKIGVRKNKVKFICHVEDLHKSYEQTGFLGECVYIPALGILKPNDVVDKKEARTILNLPKDKTIFLVFGIGHPGKNYETIVRAIKSMKSNCCVVFAGKSLPVNDAKYLSKKFNCQENTIIFDKYIPPEEHGYFFSSADFSLMSYTKEFVQDSTVLLDSIKYCLPVIASDTAWIGKMVKKNGIGTTFKTEDHESLEDTINQTLLLNEDEREKIRNNMKELANKNSWENLINQHIKIFQDTVEVAKQ
ncbi:MAG: glycosyltransferase, partial [Thermodesulfobacteriota bacterium]